MLFLKNKESCIKSGLNHWIYAKNKHKKTCNINSSMLLKENIFLNQDVHASLCKNVQQLME